MHGWCWIFCILEIAQHIGAGFKLLSRFRRYREASENTRQAYNQYADRPISAEWISYWVATCNFRWQHRYFLDWQWWGEQEFPKCIFNERNDKHWRLAKFTQVFLPNPKRKDNSAKERILQLTGLAWRSRRRLCFDHDTRLCKQRAYHRVGVIALASWKLISSPQEAEKWSEKLFWVFLSPQDNFLREARCAHMFASFLLQALLKQAIKKNLEALRPSRKASQISTWCSRSATIAGYSPLFDKSYSWQKTLRYAQNAAPYESSWLKEVP